MLSSAMMHSNKDNYTKEGVENLGLVRDFAAVGSNNRGLTSVATISQSS
jgi:hypothetical protein